MTVPSGQWITFKHRFKFVPYLYCFNCGLPQDRGSVKESPDCHHNLSWGKGVFYGLTTYIHSSVVHLAHRNFMIHLSGRPHAFPPTLPMRSLSSGQQRRMHSQESTII
jgi:hypothetical protein